MASLLNQDCSRSREETVKAESEKGSSLTAMDGSVVFNYNALHVSKEVTKKTQQLVESANMLNRNFLSLIRTAMKGKGTVAVRRMYLSSFLSVVKGLKKSIATLEECLKEEFIDLDVSCWETVCEDLEPQAVAATAEMDISINEASELRDLQCLAAEHLMGESSESDCLAGGTLNSPGEERSAHVDARTVENVKPIASESGVNMTKKLVVKLTPMALGQDSDAVCKKQEDLHTEEVNKGEAAPKDDVAGGDGASSHDASALHCEVSEPSNRRSPRLKTTPLRRSSDAKVKASHPAADSDLESEGDSAAVPPTNSEGQVLTDDEDDSDSDSVPAALLEAAALSHSSDDEDSQSSNQVAKQRLFWLAKNTADKMRHKRMMLGRTSDPSDRRSSGSESSSDGQDLPQEIQHLNTLRPVGKRPLVRRESDSAARKKRRLQSRVTKRASHPEASDSSSSSSEDKHDDDDDDDDDNDEDDHGSGSESDQKMKPITEEVTLSGSAAFHQSSGETCCDPSIQLTCCEWQP